MKKLTVSFIVHEDFSHIEEALSSLYSSTELPFQVNLTINTGSAPEVKKLQTKYPDITVLINDQPGGFAANHNRIMCLANTPFVALLNDDIVLHPQTLDLLVNYLEMHPDVGLVGPLVENPDGTPQLSAFSDPSLFRMIYVISGLNYLTKHGGIVRTVLQSMGIAQRLGVESLKTEQVTHTVPVIVGVSMVVRRDTYLQAGLMDEATMVYLEESGWHWRLRQCGWKLALVTEARVTHYNTNPLLKGWKLAEQRKGILNYYLNYRPFWQGLLIRLCIVFFHSLKAVLYLPFSSNTAHDHWRIVKLGLTWKAVPPAIT